MIRKKDSTAQGEHAKYRSKDDIFAAILKVSGRQTTKIHITYRAFLNHSQNEEYISLLLENGLLKTTNEQQSLYIITKKGINFLELYDKLNEMLARGTYCSPKKDLFVAV